MAAPVSGFNPLGLNRLQVIQVKSITKKLNFSKRDVLYLNQAKSQGVEGATALANVLGVEPGQDPKAFLRGRLNDSEYELLTKIFDLATDGNPLNA